MKRSVLITTLAIFIALCLGLSSVYGQERQARSTARTQQPGANMGRMLMRVMDLDNNEKISRREYMKLFVDADQDMDSSVTQEEMTKLRGEEEGARTQQLRTNMSRLLVRLIDLNNDRQISQSEYMGFFLDADQDKDGSATQEEMIKLMNKRRQEQEKGGPDVGQVAPDFTLTTLDGKGTVKLSDFRGKKPVVLVFGSYT